MPLSKQANKKHAAKNRTETNAKEGNVDEQFNLAFRYLLGEGCEPDSNKAREWFEAAANQGDAEAQLYLGIMLVEGKAGQDFVTAKHWFRKAANQGPDRAQSSLDFL